MSMNNQDEGSRAIESYDAEQLLMALQQGKLSDNEMVLALKRFGEIHFMHARASIEQLLTSTQPVLRAAALQTLLFHWKLSEHIATAQYFLLDPEPVCCEQAIECLQEEQAHTINARSLHLLARIVNNTQEADMLRLKAYCALLTIAGFPLSARHLHERSAFPESGQRFEDIPWIDWELITFLCENWRERAEDTSILLRTGPHPYPLHGATALSRDGNLFACISTSYDSTSFAVEVWNLSLHRYHLLYTGERHIPEEGFLRDLAYWSFDGAYLAIARREGVLDVWEIRWREDQGCTCVLSLQMEEGLRVFTWGNGSNCFAAATGSEVLYWEKPEATPPQRKVYASQDAEYPLPSYGHIEALAFSPDDTSFLTGDSGGKIFQWSLKHSCLSPSNWWHMKSSLPIVQLAWSPDGTRVAVHSVAPHESDEIPDDATSIIYLHQNHVFSFGESGFSDILGWSPDGTWLIGLRYADIFTHVRVELFDAFIGQRIASYDVNEPALPEFPTTHFTSFDAVLSPDGVRVYWCAQAYRWSRKSGDASQNPIWYGILSLPPTQRTSSVAPKTLEVMLQKTKDGLRWQQREDLSPMGDMELATGVLVPRLRLLRAALKQGEGVTLSFQVHSDILK